MKNCSRLALLVLLGGTLSFARADDPLRAGWDTLPEATKPHCYWYWLNNVVTKNGITHDLEMMAKNGIGGAYIGDIGFSHDPDTPQNGTAEPFSTEWFELKQFAVREGLRTGVKIGVFNGPGWSQSGGPWVKPDESMVYIDNAERHITGGKPFDGVLPRVKGAIRDVCVIAFPAPADDGDSLKIVRVTSNHDQDVSALGSGASVSLARDKNSSPLMLTFELATAQPVRSIEFRHASAVPLSGTMSISQDGTHFQPLRSFTLDRRAGPKATLTKRPSIVSIAPTAARFFRIELPWTKVSSVAALNLGITFSSTARLEMDAEKQLGIASKILTPAWDTFIWPPTAEPGAAAVIAPASVIDLTDKMSADGRLSWDAPAGDWIVQRLSTVSTGAGNGPAPASMSGLEVDKMSREAAARYIAEGPIGQLWKRLTPAERPGFVYTIIDSYEKGFQNWTPGLEKDFQARFGYDPMPWLPVLSGRVVASADQSDRFLWDFRRLIADLVAEKYVGGLRDAIRPMGLKLWLENYGPFGFPAEFLSYGGRSDGLGGEIWANKPVSTEETRGAASAAHIYGKPLVSCEMFTSAGSPLETPGDLKTRGDFAFAVGVNHYVLHVSAHQPTDYPGPGLVLLWGVNFNRNALWFAEQGRAWVDYVRRSCYLLQQGRPAADVAYFIGDDAPQLTGTLSPDLPAGYDFDYINSEVLLSQAKVENKRLVLSSGTSYRVLALPPIDNMRPKLLERLSQFVKAGLILVGPSPTHSPSMENYPNADEQVRQLAAELWPSDGAHHRQVGLGHVWTNGTLDEIFASANITPAIIESSPSILWKQRITPDADIFFLSNQTGWPQAIAPSFRVSRRAPELWNAETSRVESLATYRDVDGRTTVPLTLEPAESVFVVFRNSGALLPAITDISCGGRSVLNWKDGPRETETDIADSNLTQSFWVKPSGDIDLPKQSTAGNHLRGQRWVVLPPRGQTVRGPGFAERGPGFAVTGISVGRNGVVALQRWADAAPAVLVWKAADPLNDWTHICVAYRAGVPHLFVNGRDVQTGVKTDGRLIAGDESMTEGTDSGSPFENQVREFQTAWDGLDDQAIAALARPHDLSLPGLRVTRDSAGALQLRTNHAGEYTLRSGDGATRTVKVTEPLPAQKLMGPWDVTFRGVAAPAATWWDSLQSWSDSTDEMTKYFSGSADYLADFQLPADYKPARSRCVLDLGQVSDIARVTINGQPAGTAWRAPFQLDVGPALKAGQNRLEVFVTSNWVNRMIGDEQYPDDLAKSRAKNGNLTRWPDWAFNGSARPEPRRITLSSRKYVTKDTKLLPSGLVGPVTLRFEQNVAVDVPDSTTAH